MARIFSILSWVGIALLLAAVVLSREIVKPEWAPYSRYPFWAGLALVVLYVISQWREILDYFRSRNARYGAIASASVLIVLGILVAANYLSTRQNKRWDLTANKQYTLSDQTTKLLQGVDAPVKFLVFDRSDAFDRFRGRLNEYAYQSSKVSVDYVDVEKNPIEAKQYNVDTLGTVIVSYKDRNERATSDSEQDITNALIKVLNPKQYKVYFLAGHGEHDIDSSDRSGYKAITDALKRDNYQVDKLILAQTNEIPMDASEIIVAGPRTDLLDQETMLLREYMNKGGKLFVMLDPPENLKQPAPLPNITGLLKDWGVTATTSVVVDVSGRTSSLAAPVAGPPYPSHPITDNFRLLTMFPLARAMTPITENTTKPAQSFIQTAQRSWAETDLASLADNKVAPDTDKGDLAGPVSIAVAVSMPAPNAPDVKPAANNDKAADEKKPETRLAAIGDSDFAASEALGIEGNRDLFLNTVNWLAQQENLISIRPKEASDRRITMTASQTNLVTLTSIIVIPAVVFLTGAYTWWRRR